MLKKFLFIMAIIITLFVIGPKEQYSIFVAEEEDAIKWNGYKAEDILL